MTKQDRLSETDARVMHKAHKAEMAQRRIAREPRDERDLRRYGMRALVEFN